MRTRLLWVIGFSLYVSLIVFCPVKIESMPIAQGGDPVYSCVTVEELYGASNLVIRGKPSNVDIFYQNDPAQIYTIEVSEVYKGSCDKVIQIQTCNWLVNKHQPIYSNEELEKCEVLLFLTKSIHSITVIDINRGYFVINEGNVTSIGVIDRDYFCVTQKLHQSMKIDKFTQSYFTPTASSVSRVVWVVED